MSLVFINYGIFCLTSDDIVSFQASLTFRLGPMCSLAPFNPPLRAPLRGLKFLFSRLPRELTVDGTQPTKATLPKSNHLPGKNLYNWVMRGVNTASKRHLSIEP